MSLSSSSPLLQTVQEVDEDLSPVCRALPPPLDLGRSVSSAATARHGSGSSSSDSEAMADASTRARVRRAARESRRTAQRSRRLSGRGLDMSRRRQSVCELMSVAPESLRAVIQAGATSSSSSSGDETGASADLSAAPTPPLAPRKRVASGGSAGFTPTTIESLIPRRFSVRTRARVRGGGGGVSRLRAKQDDDDDRKEEEEGKELEEEEEEDAGGGGGEGGEGSSSFAVPKWHVSFSGVQPASLAHHCGVVARLLDTGLLHSVGAVWADEHSAPLAALLALHWEALCVLSLSVRGGVHKQREWNERERARKESAGSEAHAAMRKRRTSSFMRALQKTVIMPCLAFPTGGGHEARATWCAKHGLAGGGDRESPSRGKSPKLKFPPLAVAAVVDGRLVEPVATAPGGGIGEFVMRATAPVGTLAPTACMLLGQATPHRVVGTLWNAVLDAGQKKKKGGLREGALFVASVASRAAPPPSFLAEAPCQVLHVDVDAVRPGFWKQPLIDTVVDALDSPLVAQQAWTSNAVLSVAVNFGYLACSESLRALSADCIPPNLDNNTEQVLPLPSARAFERLVVLERARTSQRRDLLVSARHYQHDRGPARLCTWVAVQRAKGVEKLLGNAANGTDGLLSLIW